MYRPIFRPLSQERAMNMIGSELCPCKDDPTKLCPCKKRRHKYGIYVDPGGSLPSLLPPSTNDLTLWIEARNTGYTYNDNDRIDEVDDLSVALHHLKMAAPANQPLYKSNGGTPYIDFDDSNRKLDRSHIGAESIFDYVQADEGTVIFTIEHYDAAQPNTVYSWNAAAFDRFLTHCSFNDNNIYVDWGNRLGGGRVSFAEPANWHISGFHTVEYNRNGNAFTCFIDGVEVYNNGAAFSDGLDAGSFTFGIGDVTGFGFRLSALLIWNRSLTQDEQLQARTYVDSFRP